MKAAISIPDPLFAEGEKLAKRLKLNRSELYAHALDELVRRHKESEFTRRLNEIYGQDGGESEIDPAWERLQADALKDG